MLKWRHRPLKSYGRRWIHQLWHAPRSMWGGTGWWRTVIIIRYTKIFDTVTLPMGLFCSIFCPFLCIVAFLCYCISWESFNLFIKFWTDVLGINMTVTLLKKVSFCREPFRGIFVPLYSMFIYFLIMVQ